MHRIKNKIVLLLLLIPVWIILYKYLQEISDLIVFRVLQMTPEKHLTEALRFFIYEVPKVLMLLVLIIYTWTPPHFWALAIHRRDDYAKVNLPMLPVTHGIEFTKYSILGYTILMIMVTLLPYLAFMRGWIYLLAAVLLGGYFLYKVLVLMFSKHEKAAIQTFVYSINYLMLLFIAMVVDHYVLTPV